MHSQDPEKTIGLPLLFGENETIIALYNDKYYEKILFILHESYWTVSPNKAKPEVHLKVLDFPHKIIQQNYPGNKVPLYCIVILYIKCNILPSDIVISVALIVITAIQ